MVRLRFQSPHHSHYRIGAKVDGQVGFQEVPVEVVREQNCSESKGTQKKVSLPSIRNLSSTFIEELEVSLVLSELWLSVLKNESSFCHSNGLKQVVDE